MRKKYNFKDIKGMEKHSGHEDVLYHGICHCCYDRFTINYSGYKNYCSKECHDKIEGWIQRITEECHEKEKFKFMREGSLDIVMGYDDPKIIKAGLRKLEKKNKRKYFEVHNGGKMKKGIKNDSGNWKFNY